MPQTAKLSKMRQTGGKKGTLGQGKGGLRGKVALVTGGVVVPLVLLSLMAHGLAFAARWEGRSPPHPARSATSPRNKRLVWAGAVLLAATAAPRLLHRPVQAIPTWRPRAPDAQGDKLFRDLIPAWNDTGAPRSARRTICLRPSRRPPNRRALLPRLPIHRWDSRCRM